MPFVPLSEPYVRGCLRILVEPMPTRITAADHTQGDPHATNTLLEYGDYQCPACGQAAPIVARVVKHLGAKLLFAFRNFPLDQHEFARPAAETAEFAAAQSPESFWAMHDLLYKQQKHFSAALFPKLAKEAGLDAKALTEALEAGTYAAKLDADLKSGEKAGVPGTPAFFINGKLYEGSFSYEALLEALS
jgi:protein-disulfide isomerase